MKFSIEKISLKEVVRFVFVFLLIVAAAKLGQYFFFVWKTSPAVLWPVTGIGFAVIWLGGYRYAVPIFLALVVTSIFGPVSYLVPAVVTTPMGQVMGQMAGVYMLRRLKFDGSFSRVRNVLLVLCVFIVACMIAPTVTTFISWVTGNLTATAYYSWSRSWAGYVFSCLIFFPLIVSWTRREYEFFDRTKLEIIVVAVLLISSVFFLFWTRIASEFSFLFFSLFFIAHFWVGFRFSSRAMTSSIFVTTAIGILGLFVSPAPNKALNAQLFSTELFLMLLVPIFYIFSALVKERANTITELKLAMQKIENESNIKNEFIAVLAHELRNPLAPVKTTLELLGLQEHEPDTRKLIVSAHRQVHSMRRLLDDLLDITRVTQGKFELQIERANLSAMLIESLEATNDIYAERKHALIVIADQSQDIWLDVDSVRFVQAMVNILNNAAKYTPEGGRIEITQTVKEGNVELKIKDNGSGIEAQNLENIFEAFWQKNSVNRSGSGVGIGLSLTKRIIEMHGGTIKVESEGQGKGSAFTICMPLPALQYTHAEPVVTMQKSRGGIFKILVVDDNDVAADSLSKLLSLKGHEVETAYDGASALAMVEKYKPEIILLDISMPDLSGYEVAETLRKQGYRGVIVAVSGFGQVEDKQRALRAGFNHHFTKPVSGGSLDEYFETISR